MKTIRSMVLVSSDPESMQRGAQEVYERFQEEIAGFGLEDEVSLSRWSAMSAATMSSRW